MIMVLLRYYDTVIVHAKMDMVKSSSHSLQVEEGDRKSPQDMGKEIHNSPAEVSISVID